MTPARRSRTRRRAGSALSVLLVVCVGGLAACSNDDTKSNLSAGDSSWTPPTGDRVATPEEVVTMVGKVNPLRPNLDIAQRCGYNCSGQRKSVLDLGKRAKDFRSALEDAGTPGSKRYIGDYPAEMKPAISKLIGDLGDLADLVDAFEERGCPEDGGCDGYDGSVAAQAATIESDLSELVFFVGRFRQ